MRSEQLSIPEVDAQLEIDEISQERLERTLLLGQHAMELGME